MKKRNALLSAAVATALGLNVNVLAQDEEEVVEEVIVTGIRSSLKESTDIKRESIGVVDAISSEDIGKFPDTNLAESLQRITGVSIDRNLGEGQSVTVRGWGADFNLVTLNGRQMPTSSLGDGASAPSSRSFDFANLASEGISGVEVYKTSRASIPTGGIGATLNIKTTKPLESPGLKATVGAKGVYDTSQNEQNGQDISWTPELSGLFSNTFADDTVGIAISGSYQKRRASVNTANVGWRDGYLGSCDFQDEWGRVPNPACANSWNFDPNLSVTNLPGDNDVYEVPQNASYDLVDINRERYNGQAVLQYRPTDNVTATLDYTYSKNEIEARNSNVGIWFNHEFTESAWTNGPIAGPLFYAEIFDFMPWQGGATDLSYSGSLTANQSENKSLGLNLEWDVSDRLTLGLDYHDSSAESKPNNRYGSNMSLGTTVFGVREQSVNFENYLPVISIDSGNLPNPAGVANRLASGNAFRNATQEAEIQQLQLTGDFEADWQFADSIDFGISLTENKVNSSFGVLQTDSWGGLGTPADLPDDLFFPLSIPVAFDGLSGSDDPNIIRTFYGFDFERMADLLEQQFGICSESVTGQNIPGTCLARQTSNRDFEEESFSAFVQFNNEFRLNNRPANLVTGLRYEQTDVTASTTVPLPIGTNWPGFNEFNLVFNDPFETLTNTYSADYNYLLPSIDFDMRFTDSTILRASFSETISRQTYEKLQGGLEAATLFRLDGANGSIGDPELPPLESRNFDVSFEWYYGDDDLSYVSLGYFNKKVDNFAAIQQFEATATELDYPLLTHPLYGPRADAARAALGGNPGLDQIQAYIINNGLPGVVNGIVQGLPEDEELVFRVTEPVISPESATIDGLEFAIQHNFGETGFGAIFNYTYVNDGDDVTFDNSQSYRTSQFTLPGLSDSANIIAYYDKNGLQARLAYNWRDTFLAGSDGRNPFYREEYAQLDGNISYEYRDNWVFSLEGINLTGEDARGHRRHPNNVFFAIPGEPRYMIGVRYKY